MRAEDNRDLRHVGHDVEHAAVVVAHQAQPRRCQRRAHARRSKPFLYLRPGLRLVEHTCDLVKRNAAPRKHVGDLWHWAGRTIGKPLAGHGRAILQPIESL